MRLTVINIPLTLSILIRYFNNFKYGYNFQSHSNMMATFQFLQGNHSSMKKTCISFIRIIIFYSPCNFSRTLSRFMTHTPRNTPRMSRRRKQNTQSNNFSRRTSTHHTLSRENLYNLLTVHKMKPNHRSARNGTI